MNSNDMWIFFLCAIFAALPVPLIKHYTKTKNAMWIGLTILSYSILIYLYTFFLTNKNITILYPSLKCLSIIIIAIYGLLFFNNTFDAKKILGISLALTSIYILSSDVHEK